MLIRHAPDLTDNDVTDHGLYLERRTLMTGTTTRTHGDRVFSERMPMPDLPTMAQTFRDAGYQAYAVGKLHVYPPRDRIGFDDVILSEEGRLQFGAIDENLVPDASPGEFLYWQMISGLQNKGVALLDFGLGDQTFTNLIVTRPRSRRVCLQGTSGCS